RSGRIVNTSSESALGNMGQGNYAAAKEGIVGLTRVAARDLGRYGVTVNAIRPRAGTRLTLDPELLAQQKRMHESRVPGGRGAAAEALDTGITGAMYKPENVAPFVTWLCTDEAAHINGRTFLVGGNQVGVYTEPTVEAAIFAPHGDWSVDDISALAASTFLARMKNPAPAQAPKE
ncbi:MAG: SDR family oxidoreductase, partial [Dehalococcoidia bacterium]